MSEDEVKLAIDEERRRQTAMLAAMRIASERRHRKSMTDHMRAVGKLTIEQLPAEQRRKLKEMGGEAHL